MSAQRVELAYRLGVSYQLDLPRHTGSALDWLTRLSGQLWAVADVRGHIWAIRPSRLGAERVARKHARKYHTATNHYAQDAHVVSISGETLRDWALVEARTTLRQAAEVECDGGWNGGLGSKGAIDALRALRRAGKYAGWHRMRHGG